MPAARWFEAAFTMVSTIFIGYQARGTFCSTMTASAAPAHGTYLQRLQHWKKARLMKYNKDGDFYTGYWDKSGNAVDLPRLDVKFVDALDVNTFDEENNLKGH